MYEPPTVSVDVDGLTYSLAPDAKKSVVSVRPTDHPESHPFTDRVDLVDFRRRQRLARDVADLFARQAREVMGHLALLLDAYEREARSEPEAVELSPERRKAALALLHKPNLLDRAAKAMTALGHVGEEQNKRLGYLIAVSRLLPRPLSAILRAPSGCGKSQLLESLEALTPPESVTFLSRLTRQALFYAGANSLRHKLVLVDEQAGASEADYSIRTLQSKGFLTMQAPGKGTVRVEGPISLLSGTTSADLNPENLSRCLELALDDSEAQTRRIQKAQRRAWAGKRRAKVDLQLWQDAQRLLEPLLVTIPFAERLTFPARNTHDRRGNQKLLGLVAAHALLHQHQRDRDAHGQVVAVPADYAAVYALLQPVLEEGLDELSPRATKVYRVLARSSTPRARRELSSELRCGYNTVKRALAELLDQELVALVDAGPPATYRVLDRSVLGACAELREPEALPPAT